LYSVTPPRTSTPPTVRTKVSKMRSANERSAREPISERSPARISPPPIIVVSPCSSASSAAMCRLSAKILRLRRPCSARATASVVVPASSTTVSPSCRSRAVAAPIRSLAPRLRAARMANGGS
jgi:hypothetical protein